MTHARGTHLGGIRSIDCIRRRCTIDELTDCWHWLGGLSRTRSPIMRVAALNQAMSAGSAICFLLTGKPTAPGRCWYRICTSADCCNPAHRKEGTRKDQMSVRPLVMPHTHRIKIAATKRAASKISDETIAAIRASEETLGEIAKRFGVSTSHAWRIRRLESRRDLLAPAASVFCWGGS